MLNVADEKNLKNRVVQLDSKVSITNVDGYPFSGRMTDVNVWDYPLAEADFVRFTDTCDDEFYKTRAQCYKTFYSRNLQIFKPDITNTLA